MFGCLLKSGVKVDFCVLKVDYLFFFKRLSNEQRNFLPIVVSNFLCYVLMQTEKNINFARVFNTWFRPLLIQVFTKMTIGIIGLGLIGGSMAIDLRRNKFADKFLGCDSMDLNAMTAQRIGLVDEVMPYDELIKKSDLILLSVPVSAALRMLSDILDKINDSQVVVDICSTKEKLNDSVHYHPRRKNYVASHPMAGTEFSGPWAAIPNLFAGRAGIICNAEDSDPKAVELVRSMYDSLNMRVIYMRAAHHDVHTAYVSHISHIISFALALTVLDKEKNEKNIFDLASGGFASTARLAKSNPEMWVPIFMQNKENVLSVLDSYMDKLQQFKNALEANDESRLKVLIDDANRIKRILR